MWFGSVALRNEGTSCPRWLFWGSSLSELGVWLVLMWSGWRKLRVVEESEGGLRRLINAIWAVLTLEFWVQLSVGEVPSNVRLAECGMSDTSGLE